MDIYTYIQENKYMFKKIVVFVLVITISKYWKNKVIIKKHLNKTYIKKTIVKNIT